MRTIERRLAALERRAAPPQPLVVEVSGGLPGGIAYASGGEACPALALARGEAEPLATFRDRAAGAALRLCSPLLVFSSFPG